MNRNPTDRVRTNPLLMLLVVLAFLLLVPVLVIAIGAGDMMWFTKGFDVEPYRVVVYAGGQQTEYLPGKSGYPELARGVRECLDQGVDRGSSIGLSAGSLEDAYMKYVSVEAFFDQPVKLHAPFNTHKPTQMLFLITGRHTDFPIVFMGFKGVYYSNAPYLKTNQPLRAALEGIGYNLTNPES